MGVALRGPDRHPGSGGDLLEGEAQRVLQHDDAGLIGRDLGETAAQLAAQLRTIGFAGWIGVGGGATILEQRLARPSALTLRDVAAGIHG